MGCILPPLASPSMVVMDLFPQVAASVRQESCLFPSIITVQAPHCPWSQPFLDPVSDSRSRRASNRVTLESTVRVFIISFTRRFTVISFIKTLALAGKSLMVPTYASEVK